MPLWLRDGLFHVHQLIVSCMLQQVFRAACEIYSLAVAEETLSRVKSVKSEQFTKKILTLKNHSAIRRKIKFCKF